jgi:uncharacterized lipoprotein
MFRVTSLVLVLSLILSACASVEPKEVAVVDPLKYPADKKVTDGFTPYPIPTGNIQALTETPRPTSLSVQNPVADTDADFSVRLTKDGNGTPMLVLTTEFSEAWERLLEAVKSSRYGLADIDRSNGVLYLNSWVGKEAGKGRDAVLRRQSDRQYRLQLVRTTGDIQVTVQIDTDELAAPDDSQQILEDIKALLEQ